MRIVDRKTFIGLPKGTLYCKFVQEADGLTSDFGELMIKGDSIGEETEEKTAGFFYQSITDSFELVNHDYDETIKAMKNGVEVPLDFDAGSRDGFYEKKMRFAVFSLNDQLLLNERLGRACLDVVNAMQAKENAK